MNAHTKRMLLAVEFAADVLLGDPEAVSQLTANDWCDFINRARHNALTEYEKRQPSDYERLLSGNHWSKTEWQALATKSTNS